MVSRQSPNVVETVSILNSAVRTLLAVILVGGLGYGGWYAYAAYNAHDIAARRASEQLAEARDELSRVNGELENRVQEIAEKERQLAAKAAEIEQLNVRVEEQREEITRLDTSLRLLKVDHRIARLSVIDQVTGEDGETVSVVEFQELGEDGEPLGEAKVFRIRGTMVYIDTWVVKFDDKYIEQAEIDRSTSLVFFRRIFGELQEPQNGFALDPVGSRPAAYDRGGTVSDFEQRIWDDFWNVANDEAKQAEMGIRAAHGDAPSIKLQKGKAYRVDLRASGGLSIAPAGEAKSGVPGA